MAESPPPPDSPPRRARMGLIRKILVHIQRTLGAGILVMLPIGITVLVLKFLFDLEKTLYFSLIFEVSYFFINGTKSIPVGMIVFVWIL